MDKLYEFKPRQVVLFYGPPGPEKGIFMQQFIWEGLQDGDTCVYVTTDHAPAEIRGIMAMRGWDLSKYEKEGQMNFVDCFSWTVHEKDPSPSVVTIPSPSSLSEIAITVSTLLQKSERARIVFDGLSTILLYNDPTAVFRFFQALSAKVKYYGAVMFALLEEGMHQESVKVTLEHLSDGTINLKTVPDHVLKIERLATTEWSGYRVTDEGVVILA